MQISFRSILKSHLLNFIYDAILDILLNVFFATFGAFKILLKPHLTLKVSRTICIRNRFHLFSMQQETNCSSIFHPTIHMKYQVLFPLKMKDDIREYRLKLLFMGRQTSDYDQDMQ